MEVVDGAHEPRTLPPGEEPTGPSMTSTDLSLPGPARMLSWVWWSPTDDPYDANGDDPTHHWLLDGGGGPEAAVETVMTWLIGGASVFGWGPWASEPIRRYVDAVQRVWVHQLDEPLPSGSWWITRTSASAAVRYDPPTTV